jgi:hypothetical protein
MMGHTRPALGQVAVMFLPANWRPAANSTKFAAGWSAFPQVSPFINRASAVGLNLAAQVDIS